MLSTQRTDVVSRGGSPLRRGSLRGHAALAAPRAHLVSMRAVLDAAAVTAAAGAALVATCGAQAGSWDASRLQVVPQGMTPARISPSSVSAVTSVLREGGTVQGIASLVARHADPSIPFAAAMGAGGIWSHAPGVPAAILAGPSSAWTPTAVHAPRRSLDATVSSLPADVDTPPIVLASGGGNSGSGFLITNPGGLDISPVQIPDAIDSWEFSENGGEPPVVVPIPTPAVMGAVGLIGAWVIRRRVLTRR